MQLADHYLQLRRHFPGVAEGRELEASLETIADVLCCTRRNARLLLNRMSECDWIRWVPGRGRGNRSVLAFAVDTRDICLQQANEEAQRGELGSALNQLREHLAEGLIEEAAFMEWFSRHLGYQEQQLNESGDVLRFPVTNHPLMLDPARMQTWQESRFIRQIFSTLVTFSEKSGMFAPQLAHHWEVDASGRMWTFWLRKGVRFHHGRRMTAHDVAYTLERLKDPACSRYVWMFEPVEEIRVLKDTVLQVVLKEPNHVFLHYLTMDQTSIVPADVCEETGDEFRHRPVGSGPFRLTENHESRIVLEAHDSYFHERPHLDRIELWKLPRSTKFEQIKELGGHELAYVPFRVSESLADWQKSEVQDESHTYLLFNMREAGPHHDARVREAFRLALDRRTMIEDLGEIRFRPVAGFLWDEMEAGDLERARMLMLEHGPLARPLRLYTFESFTNRKDPWWITERCRQVGIEVEVTIMHLQEFFLCRHEADVVLSGWNLDINIEVSLLDWFRSPGNSVQQLLSPKLQARLNGSLLQMLAEPERGLRLEMLKGCEEWLAREEVVMFLYSTRHETQYHPSLQGMVSDFFGWDHFRHVWFKDVSI